MNCNSWKESIVAAWNTTQLYKAWAHLYIEMLVRWKMHFQQTVDILKKIDICMNFQQTNYDNYLIK